MSDNSPNLFKYATSELSQDAFICWLVSWASNEYQQEDNELHKVGQLFLKAMFEKGGFKYEVRQVRF